MIYKRISEYKRVDDTQMIKGAVFTAPLFLRSISAIAINERWRIV